MKQWSSSSSGVWAAIIGWCKVYLWTLWGTLTFPCVSQFPPNIRGNVATHAFFLTPAGSGGRAVGQRSTWWAHISGKLVVSRVVIRNELASDCSHSIDMYWDFHLISPPPLGDSWWTSSRWGCSREEGEMSINEMPFYPSLQERSNAFKWRALKSTFQEQEH